MVSPRGTREAQGREADRLPWRSERREGEPKSKAESERKNKKARLEKSTGMVRYRRQTEEKNKRLRLGIWPKVSVWTTTCSSLLTTLRFTGSRKIHGGCQPELPMRRIYLGLMAGRRTSNRKRTGCQVCLRLPLRYRFLRFVARCHAWKQEGIRCTDTAERSLRCILIETCHFLIEGKRCKPVPVVFTYSFLSAFVITSFRVSGRLSFVSPIPFASRLLSCASGSGGSTEWNWESSL